jgi:hypothetical protein
MTCRREVESLLSLCCDFNISLHRVASQYKMLKALNESIVPTCWDGVFSAHTLDGYNLYECESAISYET